MAKMILMPSQRHFIQKFLDYWPGEIKKMVMGNFLLMHTPKRMAFFSLWSHCTLPLPLDCCRLTC